MKLSIDDRLSHLIDILVNETDFIKADKAAKLMNISLRNVYYTIDDINKILNEAKIENLKSVYGKGYLLNPKQKEYLSKYQKHLETNLFDSLGSKERISLIYCTLYISNKVIKLKDFETFFMVSRFTIINEINELRKITDRFNIELKYENKAGYFIEGEEYHKRRAFYFLFSNVYELLKDDFLIIKDESDDIEERINKIYKMISSIKTSDVNEYYDSSLLALSYIICKIQEDNYDIGHISDYLPLNVMHKEYSFVKNTFDYLPEIEQRYIATYLYCSSIQRNTTFNNTDFLNNIVRKMNDLFCLLTSVVIDDEEFNKTLIKHLDIAFIRYKYGISIDNLLIDLITSTYKNEFMIVKKVATVIENEMNTVINDNEIGFLTLYYAGYIKQKNRYIPRVKVLLICVNGYSTSYLLKNEIENLDSRIVVEKCIGIKDYQTDYCDYDLVISTIRFENKYKEFITVSSILDENDKIKIINKVNEIIFKHAKSKINDEYNDTFGIEKIYKNEMKNDGEAVNDKFKIQFVQTLHTDNKDWKELIIDTAEPLVKEGYIDERYAQQIITNIEKYGSYMVYKNGYLLGHASTELSNKFGIAFSKLDKPIELLGAEVSKIFIFSPVNKEKNVEVIMNLISLLNDNEIKKMINDAKYVKELYNIIMNVLKNC